MVQVLLRQNLLPRNPLRGFQALQFPGAAGMPLHPSSHAAFSCTRTPSHLKTAPAASKPTLLPTRRFRTLAGQPPHRKPPRSAAPAPAPLSWIKHGRAPSSATKHGGSAKQLRTGLISAPLATRARMRRSPISAALHQSHGPPARPTFQRADLVLDGARQVHGARMRSNGALPPPADRVPRPVGRRWAGRVGELLPGQSRRQSAPGAPAARPLRHCASPGKEPTRGPWLAPLSLPCPAGFPSWRRALGAPGPPRTIPRLSRAPTPSGAGETQSCRAAETPGRGLPYEPARGAAGLGAPGFGPSPSVERCVGGPRPAALEGRPLGCPLPASPQGEERSLGALRAAAGRRGPRLSSTTAPLCPKRGPCRGRRVDSPHRLLRAPQCRRERRTRRPTLQGCSATQYNPPGYEHKPAKLREEVPRFQVLPSGCLWSPRG